MRILFTITLFLSSALLFLVQPMIAKMILPRFGGSPGVWNTSMLFFQAALLLGYGYAHIATKYLGPRVQALSHVAILLIPLVTLPIALPNGIQSGAGNPAPLVLLILAISVGLPFFVVSAGAPLLQRWFAATDDPHAKDPYFLYSASNLGSMLALLAYPFVLEPTFKLSEQSRFWSYGYYFLVALMAVCAGVLWLHRGAVTTAKTEPTAEEPLEEVDRWQRLRWIGLAFCPSSLMLGVTTYLTSNIAPVPLLWVVPLALYLLTFIVAFARKQVLSTAILGRILPLIVIPLAFTMILEASDPKLIVPLIILHLIVFFAVSLLCHTRLAESRPKAERLTEFYFYVSLGGVLGGVFNALIAPTIFNSFFEYPMILAFACFFRPTPPKWKPSKIDIAYPIAFAVVAIVIDAVAKHAIPEPSTVRSAIAIGIPVILVFIATDRPVRFAASLFLLFAVTSVMQVAVAGRIVEGKRSFFGVHRVEEYRNQYGLFRDLIHGNTVHGKENFGAESGMPLTYYYPSGPIGQVFTTLGPKLHNVAIVGLGIGSLAAYGKPGQDFTYYEIDPDVVALAQNSKLFTFLSDCKAKLNIKVGDARLELAKAPEGAYDLIVLDAFSSDSIPMHLLTREAAAMYLSKLAPGGMIAFHISNRYLDLKPVLGNVAQALQLQAVVQDDRPTDIEAGLGKYASIWTLMTRDAAALKHFKRISPGWEDLDPKSLAPLWTDDYSNIVGALKIFSKEE